MSICHLGGPPISLHNFHLILHMITLSLDSIYSKLRNHSPLKNQLNIFSSPKCIFFLETGLSLPQKALAHISESQNWLWIIDMHFILKTQDHFKMSRYRVHYCQMHILLFQGDRKQGRESEWQWVSYLSMWLEIFKKP